jgi:hypothetical protein
MRRKFFRLIFVFLAGIVNPVWAGIPELAFLENKGQWPQEVAFKSEIGPHNIWFGRDKIHFQIQNPRLHPYAQLHAMQQKDSSAAREKYYAHHYSLMFPGSRSVRPEPASAALKPVFNFYIGKEEKAWASGVQSYASIRYPDLYPGTDLTLSQKDGRLKYDIEMEAGCDGKNISFRYLDTWGVEIRSGRLVIKTALGLVEEFIPKAYQLVEGHVSQVACRFVLKGKDVVGFEFPDGLSPSHKTIIDPVLEFFTYSGAAEDNWANTAVSDKNGNSYVAGIVFGDAFPTTAGAFDRSYNGPGTDPYFGYDIGILKFDPTGSQLLSGTFLGGQFAETPHSLALDPDENLIVLGSTSSPNFPTSAPAFQRIFRGGPTEFPFGSSTNFILPRYSNGADLFVFKLRKDGGSMLASTLIGGTGSDGLMNVSDFLVTNYGDQFRGDVVVDSDGGIYIGSNTKSADFPVRNAAQSLFRGVSDGVAMKFSSNLSQLVWSTYTGGSADDAFFSAALLGSSQIALCGGSLSTDFPVREFAYQQARNGADIDGVIAVFDRNSGQRLAATYTGTVNYDQAYLVQGDLAGNVYVMGQTMGVMPLSPGRYGQSQGGQFIQKFNSGLSQLIWGTTIGSAPMRPNISPTAFLVDSCNRIYVAGWGGKVNYEGRGFSGAKTFGLPVTSDALQSATTDSSDFYFLVLQPEATGINYGTYFGAAVGRGEHVDGGTSRFSKNGIITHAVCGCRDDENNFFRGSPGAYRRDIGSSNCNIGVMKINLLDLKVNFDLSGQIQCPSTLTLRNESQNGDTYVWYFGNGDSLQTNDPIVRYKYESPGTYIISLKATNLKTCRRVAFAFDTITIPNPFPFDSLYQKDFYCTGDTLFPSFPDLIPYAITWSPGLYLNNPAIHNPVVLPLSDVNYTIKARNSLGCTAISRYEIKNRKIDLGIGVEKEFFPCEGQYKVRFFSNRDSSEKYVWYFSPTDSVTGKEVVRTYFGNGRIPVRLSGSLQNCGANAVDTLNLNQQKVNIIPNFTTIKKLKGCNELYIKFLNKTLNGQAFIWDFGDGEKSTETDPEHQYAESGLYRVKLRALNAGCAEELELPLNLEKVEYPNLITQNADGKNDAFIITGILPGWKLEVFNRWGRKVYSSDDYKNDWIPDNVEEGTYFYHVAYPDGGHCNDWVMVIKK